MSRAININFLNYNVFNELCFVFCWLRANYIVSVTIICLLNYSNKIIILIILLIIIIIIIVWLTLECEEYNIG